MDGTRRPLDRSISKEQGLKKPRLTEGPAAHHGNSSGRGFIRRSVLSKSDATSRVPMERDSESSDSVRGAYQYQPQLHQELVNQYKIALSELTFNSKPIITNLTIIAGENLHAAKAIAEIVCSNIIEVPTEQKLPSLYLLDSIVKNIGRDYIKYFASRLPEVFSKAYKQVDPSMHRNMRHLFGTWKGVFPQHPLQMIEKELGFTTTTNFTSLGTTSRPESQEQRPAHGIHVNPKYLEARQRVQTTSGARRPGVDISGSVMSLQDAEAPRKMISISSAKSREHPLAEPVAHHYKDEANEAVLGNKSSMPYLDSEYSSSVSGILGVRPGSVSEKFKEQRLDRHLNGFGSDAVGDLLIKTNGRDTELGLKGSYADHHSTNSAVMRVKQNASRSTNGVSRSWKNSEEEEYKWDGMNTRTVAHNGFNTSAKDNLTIDNNGNLDFDSHFPRPQLIQEKLGLRIDDEASTDSIPGAQVMPSLSEESSPPEGRVVTGRDGKLSGYTQGYPSRLKSSVNMVGRVPSESHQATASVRGANFKFSAGVRSVADVSKTQEIFGVASTQSAVHQHSLSPSFSAHNQTKQPNNLSESNRTSAGPPKDPRKPPSQRNIGSYDRQQGQKNTRFPGQSSQGSMFLEPQDVCDSGAKKFQAQILQTSSTAMPPLHQKKCVSYTQKRKLVESSHDGQKVLSQVSDSKSQLTVANSATDQSNPLTNDSPGQSIPSNLSTTAVKSGIPGDTFLMESSTKLDCQEVKLQTSPGVVQPDLSSAFTTSSMLSHAKSEQLPFPSVSSQSSLADMGSEDAPDTVNSISNPVSSLLSSLVAKGLISASKSDFLSSASGQKPDQPHDRNLGVSSASYTPDACSPTTIQKPLLSISDEPSSSKPTTEVSACLPLSPRKIKNLIGFEFKPKVVRNLHPEVVTDLLSDLPCECNICGIRLKLQQLLDRHTEWHALKTPERGPHRKNLRGWYANSIDWVAGVCNIAASNSPSELSTEPAEALEITEQMVSADDSQCACIICGELFEDLYSLERDEWMFKGAIYLNILSSGSHEGTRDTSNAGSLGPIVHANCIPEDLDPDSGLIFDVKMAKGI